MLRKLPLAMAIALAVMPIQSQALGLGDITTRSVLNQSFKAEIKLLSVLPGELDGVKVSLASPEAFSRAGVERPFSLSYLKFETFRKDNGEAIIKVFSREAIKEPFLNFLVEVDWPKGRMVREFTVLLDPPMTTGKKQKSFSTPKSSAPSIKQVEPSNSFNDYQGQQAPSSSAQEYGPVKRNETLWTIANRYRGNNVSVNQMMMAILDANPQAFTGNNINNLKAGAVLRIPANDEVLNVSSRDAQQKVSEQYRDWKNSTVSAKSAPKMMESESKPEMMTEPMVETASQEEIARLKLSGSEVASEMGTGADSDSEVVTQELISAQEKVVSSQGEAQDLRSQMSLMEQQLKDMQRLLELKDEQLAKIQAANDTGMAATDVEVAESDTEIVEEIAAEEVVEETVEMVEESAMEAAPAEEMMESEVAGESEVIEAEVASKPEVDLTAPAVVAEPEMKKPATPKKEQGIVEMLTGSATMMGISIAVLVVLLALIWAAFSRRKDNSVVVAPVSGLKKSDPEEPSLVEPVADDASDEDNSFLSEFTPGDLNALQDEETGEVDPVSEADVYIAYGRFDQAETLVQQALDADPDNSRYQNKLLEIHYANKDLDKFSTLATQMYEAGAENKDADAWNRAKLMGSELDPENPIFADAMDAPSMDLGDDLDMALSDLDSELSHDTDSPLGDFDAMSDQLEDLDLDAVAGKSDVVADEVVADEVIAEPEEVESLSLDLPEIELEASPVSDDIAIDELAAELESFDLDSDESASIQLEAPEIEELPADDMLLPDDDDLSLGLDAADDVTTKIDLAQAYMEMGDKEGARGILEEVVEEGSEAQKQQAKALLSEIG